MKKVVLTARGARRGARGHGVERDVGVGRDGITARTITIGGTHPLTGPASLYATIPAAMKAYFSLHQRAQGP